MASKRPPIKEIFIIKWIGSKFTKWKITVVGIKKISKRELPNLIFFVNIKRNDPITSTKIAATKNIADKNSGKPWAAIYSVLPPKSRILLGIAFMNIALKNNLPRKFRE